MEKIFQTIWEMSLFAVPVILILAICSNLLGKRYGARWRYLVWLVVAIRLCVPIQLSLPGRMEIMQVQVPSVQSSTREVLAQRTPDYFVQRDTAEPTEPATPIAPAEQTQEESAEKRDAFDFLLAYPYVLWLGGVLGFLAWQGWKYYDFRRMLKRNRRKIMDASVLDTYYTLCRETGMEKRPAIYFCEALPSPLCVGLFRTAVYLNSEEREPAEMRLILKHELTHCKRKDLWFKGLLLWARALHFFNPFVHWMAHLAEKDMELSCDLVVMADCGMAEREAYSMAILRTVREAKSKNMQMSTAFSGGKEELKMRFENIFDMTQKKRGIALFLAAALVVCGGTAFVGCAESETTEKTLSGTVYGDYTEETVHELYGAKLQYIGDHIGVGKILGLLPLPEGVTNDSEGIELYTDKEPYGVRRHLQWQSNAETAYTVDGESYTDDRWMQIQGMIFLVLVENAGDYNLSLHHVDAADGQVVTSFSFDREQAKKYFGEQDLRDFASDEGTFRNFVLTINRYFYEGISTPEQILALSQMDAAAAQERMQEMASGDFLEETKEDQSLSYQMILADSLVGEIAAQKLTSSNPADYLKCTQYDELIKLGEPALRAFLSEFAEGSIGDDLEGYIKVSACQDILGEHRDKDVLPTPTEWYRNYTATDSTYCAFFTYGDTDTTLYTEDLAKKYSMGGSDQYSIVAAGKDERLRAVYTALSDRFNNYSKAGYTTTIYAPLIEGMKENGNKMQVFAVIFDSSYTMSRTKKGYALFERGGSVVPSRLDFEKRNGKWILTDWTQAEDGSYYADSIKKMCDGDNALAKKMISYDSDACQMLLWQNMIYYMKANYGGMELPIYFDSYMDEENIKKISKFIDITPTYDE